MVSLIRYSVQSDLLAFIAGRQHTVEGCDCLVGTNFVPLATPLRAWLALLRCPASPNRNHFVGFRFGFSAHTKTESQPSEAGAILEGGAREQTEFSPQAETELSALCADAVAWTLPLTLLNQAKACPFKSARLLYLIPTMKLSRTNCTVRSTFPFVWPR